jgi:hypothetical protein
VTDPDGRDLTISCGVALHHLVVALGHAGHDAYVKRMPDPQDNSHLATITISDAPPDPAPARLFGAIGRRHTELRRMRCQPVPVALQAALVDAAHRFDVRMVGAGVRSGLPRPTPRTSRSFDTRSGPLRPCHRPTPGGTLDE